MQSISIQSSEKLRGGYYTPDRVADFLTRWAVRDDANHVLEPSCGDGAFLRALRRSRYDHGEVTAVEIDGDEASKARSACDGSSGWNVVTADFLEYSQSSIGQYDAVIGNPPYIRYQFLPDMMQERMRAVFARNGIPFTKHCNAWLPFVVESINHLRPGGRLGMVVPAELLNVIHSGGLRSHLLRTCSRIMIVDPKPLLFPDALQGTLLLLAVKGDGTGDCMLSIRTCEDLGFLDAPAETLFTRESFESLRPSPDKWMRSLLTAQERDVYDHCLAVKSVRRFSELADIKVGIVTGANDFFLVDDSTVERYDLEAYAHPMFGRSSHARGIIFDETTARENRAAGLPTNFVDFNGLRWDELTAGAQEYIRHGESLGLDMRFKCRIREPWYSVPSVSAAPVALLKRAYHVPRLIWNKDHAYTTDTAYRITPTQVDPVDLTVSWLNPLTALAVELGGRSYGGGVLELVPSEIRRLPVPISRHTMDEALSIDSALKTGSEVDGLLHLQNTVLKTTCGLSDGDLGHLDEARERLMTRRLRQHD